MSEGKAGAEAMRNSISGVDWAAFGASTKLYDQVIKKFEIVVDRALEANPGKPDFFGWGKNNQKPTGRPN